MKRIELRGVIVSGNYDGEWAQGYIERGIFTPESRVRKALAEANEDVELYINSQGGSVLAGYEIANALTAFESTGKQLRVTVGALAASMAAVIVSGVKAENVSVHQNSRIMFHGAYGLTEGGSGAHEDAAVLLASINQQVIENLSARNPDMADEIEGWFEEGRAGWLTAKQAVDMGIAGSIIGVDAEAGAKISSDAAQKILENGIDVAAYDFDAATPDAEAGDTHEEPHNVASFVPLAEYEVLKARYAGMQSAKDKEIAALKSEYGARESEHIAAMSAAQKKIDELTAQTEAYKSEIAKAEADVIAAKSESEKALADLAAEGERRKTAEARHAALVGGVLLQDGGDADNLTWPDVSQRLGYAEAKKRYPDLYAQYGEQMKSKGKTK